MTEPFPLGNNPLTREEEEAAEQRKRRLFLVVVDGTEEGDTAMRYACRRAKTSGGRVALMAVMERPETQQWGAIEELMREEKREEAEQLLQRRAKEVQETTGHMPIMYVREGDNARDALFNLVKEEPVFSILVLGAGTGSDGPGPIISSLTSKNFTDIRLPVTIVPGDLSVEEMDVLT